MIVLLRSVNVGTRNRISNADLGKVLARLGYSDLRPVLQSGNLVIDDAGATSGPELEQALERALHDSLGLDTEAFAYAARSLWEIASTPPWTESPSKVHLFLHKQAIDEPGKERLGQSLKPTEVISLSNDHFWLHAPEGVARSKIAARASSIIGQPVTARSLSSLRKILAKTGHNLQE